MSGIVELNQPATVLQFMHQSVTLDKKSDVLCVLGKSRKDLFTTSASSIRCRIILLYFNSDELIV